MPKVSVIITTFNRANFLEKAIKSVLAQTYADFELLILDNSSTDNTEEVILSFQDSRIRHIKHQPILISEARNLGVREARGEFVAFLDDDDEWLEEKLKLQIKVFENNSADTGLVYGGFIWVDSNSREVGRHRSVLEGMILGKLLVQKDFFTGSASNPMIRKSVFDTIGHYNEKVATGEDWELYLRLAERYPINFTPEIVVKINQHAGPRLGDKLKSAAELELMVMDRYQEIFEKNRKLKSFYLQKIGGKFYRTGEVSRGRAYILQAIKIYPLNYIAYGQYLISLLGPIFYQKTHKGYQIIKKRL